MNDEANGPLRQPATSDARAEESFTPRRSISHGSAEHDRAVTALEEGMDALRRAENASRHAGHAFRRAMRDVADCELAVAEAKSRLQRVPWPRLTLSPGSV